MDPKEIVRRGYDRVSYAYRSTEVDSQAPEIQSYTGWINELLPLLAPGSAVLDLGCGCGVPVAALLTGAGHPVIGVDLSPVQIERARAAVPGADFCCADMTTLDFARESFAAVVSFYAIIHVPLDEQPRLLARIYDWLQTGGYFMATVGHSAWTGTEESWLDVTGATMYWSEAAESTYVGWLEEQGFTVLWTRFVPEGDGGHTLVLVQKRHAPGTA